MAIIAVYDKSTLFAQDDNGDISIFNVSRDDDRGILSVWTSARFHNDDIVGHLDHDLGYNDCAYCENLYVKGNWYFDRNKFKVYNVGWVCYDTELAQYGQYEWRLDVIAAWFVDVVSPDECLYVLESGVEQYERNLANFD